MYTYNKFGSRNSSIANKTNQDRSIKKPIMHQNAGKENIRVAQKYNAKEDELDYCNNYVHTGIPATKYIRNIDNPIEGYPKLAKLHQLKRQQVKRHALQPYGVRVSSSKIIPTLNQWIDGYGLKFDVIMIGALVENQFILPILNSIPIHRLCSKPGFLFIWATTQKIQELTNLLNNDNFNKKFRRSEELIFLPTDSKSPYYPGDNGDFDSIPLFEKQQWHCWMCITGTVRRSSDNHLIHCNVDTDLQIESPTKQGTFNAVPEAIYRVAENFSNSNRRLHLIPSKLGENAHIKLRPGWVIMGPDVLINNFSPSKYQEELYAKSMIKYKESNNAGYNKVLTQFLVPQTNEIEDLRPKSPVITAK